MQQPLGGGNGRPPSPNMDSSLNFLTQILSVVTAFLGAPYLYDFTSNWVERIVMNAYGEGMLDLSMLAWQILTFPLVYALARVGWMWAIGLLAVSAFMRLSPAFA